MFPVAVKYIKSEYIKNGQPYFIANPKVLKQLQKSANVAKSLLKHGVKFTPTQPDVIRIEKIMIEELLKENIENNF